MTDKKDVATSWLEELAARDVSVTVRNNRLWLHPASAHRALSDDEIITLRHHRQAIKDVVKAGIPLDVVRATPIAEPVTPAPEPLCTYCQQSPTECAAMREHSPDVFETLHPDDPEVKARLDEAHHRLMMRTMGVPSRWL